ncbi:MAG: hypothetical protein ACYC4R_15550, partial [Anaerolineae bacterium]
MFAISFREGSRPAARYVSGTTVREEALDDSRLIGLYWSASGQAQRENVTERLPGLDRLRYPIQVFDLEIDGQQLHNLWEWVGSSEREGPRPGTREAVVELRHTLRPVTVKVVTRLDGTSFLVRYLEITNTGDAPAALASVSPWSGMLWDVVEDLVQKRPDVESAFTLGYFDAVCQGNEGNLTW